MQTKTETCFVWVGPWVPGLPQQTLNFFVILFTKLGLSLFRLTFQTKIKSSSRSIMNLFHHGAYQQSTRSIFFNLETILRTFPIQFRASRRDKNFWHSISGFETRLRIFFFNRYRDSYFFILDYETRHEIEIKTVLRNLLCLSQLDWYIPKKRAVKFLTFIRTR